jgi:predicted  nucleic acid-binding Zn-ribbon protein
MELDALNKLEERISKAIAHIEKLTEAKSKLEEENQELNGRVAELEKELKSKAKSLKNLEKQSGQVSEKVREKVEGLLNRISNFEQSQT